MQCKRATGSGEGIELFFVLADVELVSDGGGDEGGAVFAELGNRRSYDLGGSVYPLHCLVEMARYFRPRLGVRPSYLKRVNVVAVESRIGGTHVIGLQPKVPQDVVN